MYVFEWSSYAVCSYYYSIDSMKSKDTSTFLLTDTRLLIGSHMYKERLTMYGMGKLRGVTIYNETNV